MTSPTPGVTADELARLRRLAEAATPGEWFQSGRPWFTDDSQVFAGDEDPHVGRFVADTAPDTDEPTNGSENAVYIAAANPAAILRLLAHAEALEARVRTVEKVAKELLPMAFAFVEKRDGFEAADRFEARYFAILFGEGVPPVSRSEGAPK